MRGREFSTDSTSTTAVSNSSKLSLALPTIFLKQRFIDRISRSNTPPHQGAFGRLNVQLIPISLDAALNVLALSDTIRVGNPLRATNLLRHMINDGVERSLTMSMCTARVTQHVNKQIQILDVSVVPAPLM